MSIPPLPRSDDRYDGVLESKVEVNSPAGHSLKEFFPLRRGGMQPGCQSKIVNGGYKVLKNKPFLGKARNREQID
jgi:hypothetical protein